MKKKDILFWWVLVVVVVVGLFIVYKILEYNWRCTEGIRKYEAQMRKQGHKLSPLGDMINKY